MRAIERLTRLTLPKTDRRGAAGPRPAPVVRKAASAAMAPAPRVETSRVLRRIICRRRQPRRWRAELGHRRGFGLGGARVWA